MRLMSTQAQRNVTQMPCALQGMGMGGMGGMGMMKGGMMAKGGGPFQLL